MTSRGRNSSRRWILGAILALVGVLAAMRAPGISADVGRPDDDYGYIFTPIAQGLLFPTSFAFGPDGRTYIAEKRGMVRVAISGTLQAQSFIDLTSEVNGNSDRGLLSIELHPDFPAVPYVYLLYTHDPPGAPEDGSGARVSRLLRVEADPANLNLAASSPASRTVILGASGTITAIPDLTAYPTFPIPTCVVSPTLAPMRDCVPSDAQIHSIGGLAFGSDGSLYVGIGDASYFLDVIAFSMRAQNVDSLAGKVLRINPLTGDGYSDNPFFDGDPGSNRSKVFAYGLRNPFRLTIQPETGNVFIGDVGYNTWEELNTGRGANFGWPCYEGGSSGSLPLTFPFSTTACDSLYALGPNGVVTPAFAYPHGYGNAIIAGTGMSGTTYPGVSPKEMLVGDYDLGWLRLISTTAEGHLNIREWLALPQARSSLTQMRVGPDGLVYVNALISGEILQIRYAPESNRPPVVSVQVWPDRGSPPLTTTFSSLGTFDPESQPMTYTWSFGNGQSSDGPYAQSVYTATGIYTATLVVTDVLGGAASIAHTVYVGPEPTLTITAPTMPATFTSNSLLMFAGEVWDPTDGDISASIHWEADLFHANHVHPGIFSAIAPSGTFTAPEHDPGMRIRLCAQATDSAGWSTLRSCVVLFDTLGSVLYLPHLGPGR